MAEEKTFAPTATRIRKARREGNIPQASELLSLIAFSAGWFTLQQVLPNMALCLAFIIQTTPKALALGMVTNGEPFAELKHLWLHPLVGLVGDVIAVLVAISILTIGMAKCIGSVGWSNLTIKPERLSPGPNLKRILSPQTLMATARALCITCLIVVVMLGNVWHCAQATLSTIALRQVVDDGWLDIAHGVNMILCVGAVFAVFEAHTALMQWYRKLRMDHAELKREFREQSADPHQQAQRKRRHRRLLRNRKIDIQKATVVVTNPTHIAIALLYNPPEIGVPIIVARAADQAAAEVRAIAQRAGVPLIEAVSVARMLYAQGEEGDAVPLESYALVAPLVASALAQRGR